jgi:hypothetical protein
MRGMILPDQRRRASPPDREPQTPPKERNQQSAGYRSRICLINVEIRTELEKHVLYALYRATRFEPMGMTSEVLGAVLPILPSGPS